MPWDPDCDDIDLKLTAYDRGPEVKGCCMLVNTYPYGVPGRGWASLGSGTRRTCKARDMGLREYFVPLHKLTAQVIETEKVSVYMGGRSVVGERVIRIDDSISWGRGGLIFEGLCQHNPMYNHAAQPTGLVCTWRRAMGLM